MKTQEQQDAIYTEQIRLMYDALPISVIGNIINAGMLVWVQWSVTAHGILLAWLMGLGVILIFRAVSGGFYRRRHPQANNCRLWGRILVGGVVATGLCWGAVPMLFFPSGLIVHQALMAVVFSGMAAGAVSSLSYQRFPIYFFISALLIPLAVHFILDGEQLGYVIGSLNVLFFVMIMVSARRFYAGTQQNIDLRLQAGVRERVLAENEEKYRQIFNAAPIGIAHYQEDGMLLDCNTQFCNLIGRPKQDLVRWVAPGWA